MHLFLIRHAESENNARPEHQRVEDPAITPRGVRQAESLADWLDTLKPDLLACSPFRRALQTTQPAAHRLGTKIEVWSDVFERGGCYKGWNASNKRGMRGLGHAGILELIPHAEIESEVHPDGWWQHDTPEADAKAAERARTVKSKLESRLAATPQRLALVTHADFLRLLLGHILDQNGIQTDCLGPICNAGITHLEFTSAGWQLHWFNAVTHLPYELITSTG